MEKYLDSIVSPDDLKGLSIDELAELAPELRERIIDVLSVNGGHLASSLGCVEIAIALHYVFDCPRDKIVWDVGHQAYSHKILTGRNDVFGTLRSAGGISGFPRRCESEFDPFGAGHASTAVSAALGLAAARDLRGGKEKVIAVIGDASLTGGLCYEALNNAGHSEKNLIVILNDNEMSISRNVGAISKYLNKIITSPTYNRVRTDMQLIVKRIPAIGKRMFETARRLEESVKYLMTPGILFEELGLRYFGPVDGHDIGALVNIIDRIKEIEQPCILHVLTRKGKGYVPAEKHPEYFHGTSPFNVKTGRPKTKTGEATFSDVFSDFLVERGRLDPDLVAITAAMCDGTGLNAFSREFPERFFDVGIAEEHAVTFAAGLAANGCNPVVAIYATFLQRAYDQLVHDVCLQGLPVVFAVDRGGIVGADGATHTGQFVFSYLRHVPGLIVTAPSNAHELRMMLSLALDYAAPAAVVYPKGSAAPGRSSPGGGSISIGKSILLREGSDCALIAAGSMVRAAEEAAELLAGDGKSAAVVDARFVKPLDDEMITALARETGRIVTLEENAVQGGFGSAVLELITARGLSGVQTLCIGIPDAFVEHGERREIMASLGMDAASVARRVMERFWP